MGTRLNLFDPVVTSAELRKQDLAAQYETRYKERCRLRDQQWLRDDIDNERELLKIFGEFRDKQSDPVVRHTVDEILAHHFRKLRGLLVEA